MLIDGGSHLQVASDPVHEEEELHMHSSWTAAAGACIRRRLHQVLSTLQVFFLVTYKHATVYMPNSTYTAHANSSALHSI